MGYKLEQPESSSISDGMVLLAEIVKLQERETPFYIDDANPDLGFRDEISWRFRVIEGDNTDKTVWGSTGTKFMAHENCKFYSWVLSALGIDEIDDPDFVLELDALEGIICRVRIGTRKTGKIYVSEVLPEEIEEF